MTRHPPDEGTAESLHEIYERYGFPDEDADAKDDDQHPPFGWDIDGPWIRLDPVPGWEGFNVWLHPTLVDGEPKIIGLRLEPKADADPRRQALTAARLRTFPVAALAPHAHRIVYQDSLKDRLEEWAWLGGVARSAWTKEQEGRKVATPAEAAVVYQAARAAGQPGRAAVVKILNISTRTADRYLSEARRRGFLPALTEKRARVVPDTDASIRNHGSRGEVNDQD